MENMQIPSQRIVSLTASITETLYALGLEDRVVGVTDTCDYPQAVNEKPNVNCWFDPDIDKLMALHPDLVIGARTAHQQLKATLESQDVDVMLADPESVDDVLDLIEKLGICLGATKTAATLLERLKKRLDILDTKVSRIPIEKRLTACRILEWDEGRIYVAGSLSFQYDVITRAGGINITGGIEEAYPKISMAQLRKWDPAVIFFCGYGKDFMLRLLEDPEIEPFQAVQTGRLYRFDCGLTCRNGPRIVDMAELLHKTLYE